MTGISFNQARRVCLSYFYRTPKPAIASTFLGMLGGIYSIFLRNDTYLKAALLWTAASYAAGYFTRSKKKMVIPSGRHPCNILNHSGLKKISAENFKAQANALYRSRCTVATTTLEQRKQFYHLVSVSHLFSICETRQLGNALNQLNILRPYMEDSSNLSKKVDIKRRIPSPSTVPQWYIFSRGPILRHRDYIRLQALEEFENFGRIPLESSRFNTAINRVFEMIAQGILEKPAVQEAWEKSRRDKWGIMKPFEPGEDDAQLYFERKFWVDIGTPTYVQRGMPGLDTSNPWQRFFEVKPIHSNVRSIRGTHYPVDYHFGEEIL